MECLIILNHMTKDKEPNIPAMRRTIGVAFYSLGPGHFCEGVIQAKISLTAYRDDIS